MLVDTALAVLVVGHGHVGEPFVTPAGCPLVTDDPIRSSVVSVVTNNDDAVVQNCGAVLDVQDAPAVVLESWIRRVEVGSNGVFVDSRHDGVVVSRDINDALSRDILGFGRVVFALTHSYGVGVGIRGIGHSLFVHEVSEAETCHTISTTVALRVAVNLLLSREC